jgi:hypothetical protein
LTVEIEGRVVYVEAEQIEVAGAGPGSSGRSAFTPDEAEDAWS